MNNKLKLIFIILIVIVFLGILGTFLYLNYQKSNDIPTDYIAVFNGGSGEVTYSTYIYKIDNGQANYGFKYINTRNATISWGSSEWETKITGKGKVSWTDDVFTVAKENNAYTYVRLPDDNTVYSIEEFREMFLMD